MSRTEIAALPVYGVALDWVDTNGVPGAEELGRGTWPDSAVCASTKEDLWFADPRSAAVARAKAMCSACPVARQCLAAALLFGEPHGVWGGLDPCERGRLMVLLRRGQSLGAVVDGALRNRASRSRDVA